MPKFKQRETCGERTHSTPLRVRLKEGEGRSRAIGEIPEVEG